MYRIDRKEEAVMALKKLLYEAAMSEEYEFSPPTVQTDMRKSDRESLSAFQAENRLSVTGKGDLETLSKLKTEAQELKKRRKYRSHSCFCDKFPLKIGDDNEAVFYLQNLLRDLDVLLEREFHFKERKFDEETAKEVRHYRHYFCMREGEIADEALTERLEFELRARKAFSNRD